MQTTPMRRISFQIILVQIILGNLFIIFTVRFRHFSVHVICYLFPLTVMNVDHEQSSTNQHFRSSRTYNPQDIFVSSKFGPQAAHVWPQNDAAYQPHHRLGTRFSTRSPVSVGFFLNNLFETGLIELYLPITKHHRLKLNKNFLTQ
jgi:hypothetical protein